ncbi:MAG: ubiquinol-cytochrome c reductase iron-sulfur subunit [Ignavibacteria bacterium]|jgi:Rieske Fe-S protein|nr:ubiquinol-cytochrome c reductase iron-sulfur subunit [Ignavibacteria bacterium]
MMNEVGPTGPKENRRDFLMYFLGGGVVAWLGAVLYPILAFLIPPKQGEVEVTSVKAGKLGEIEKESGTIVRFGNKPVILIRNSSGECVAFSATCTHLDCTVQYRKDLGVIWCACHNGRYDLKGQNISGPPPRPLDEYRVIIQGEDVLISKKV